MRASATVKAFVVPLTVWLALFALDAHAAVDSSDLLDSVLARYQAAASGWGGTITRHATWLFWCLATISLVWTGGMLALRKADIGDFFAEFVRFIIFVGFFWWLLINGPNFATSIYDSLRQVAGEASGLGRTLSPSGVVDVGFAIFDKVIDQSSFWSPINSAVGIIIAAIILVILALVGINMLLLLVAGWILAFGGVFFLGFGGSRWTSDMAIGYFKTVLNIAMQLFTMVLIVGIGKTFLDDYYSNMNAGITLKEMGVMLIVAVILFALVNKLPAMIGGIATGAGVGSIGQLGGGAALAGMGVATAAAATGGAMMAAGAAGAAGGASAIMAAFSKARSNVDGGTDVLSRIGGGGGGGSETMDVGAAGGGSVGGSGQASNSTPFSQAAGFESTGRSQATQGAESMSSVNAAGTSGSGSSSAGKGAGLASSAKAVGNVGRIAVDAGANLVKGAMSVAKAKADSVMESASSRIAQTTGGKIAAAIRAEQGSSAESPSFEGNSLSSGSAESGFDPATEVAEFVNRDRKKAD